MSSASMDMPADLDMAAVAMSDDMPCCPPEKPAVPDCQKGCPLATLCLAKCLQGLSPAGAVLFRVSMAETLLASDDPRPTTLAQAPPPRPPRS